MSDCVSLVRYQHFQSSMQSETIFPSHSHSAPIPFLKCFNLACKVKQSSLSKHLAGSLDTFACQFVALWCGILQIWKKCRNPEIFRNMTLIQVCKIPLLSALNWHEKCCHRMVRWFIWLLTPQIPTHCTSPTIIGSLFMATTRYLHVVCIYGAICLQILFLNHHILLFCHEILKFFA
jgi:hypothetical protein